MTLAQLLGRYYRLQDELTTVSHGAPLHRERLVRLENDVRATRLEIVDARDPDEQCDELGTLGVGLFAGDFHEARFEPAPTRI